MPGGSVQSVTSKIASRMSPSYSQVMKGDEFVDPEAANVVITAGDVTTISSAPPPRGVGDPVAAGGDAVATSLSPDGEVLNVAFLTADGHAQIIQVKVRDLRRDDSDADADNTIIEGDLTTVSDAAIAAGEGAATSLPGIAVAAELGAQGELSLSFVDGNGDLQLIETNVAELVP